jgi:hypothetical protein
MISSILSQAWGVYRQRFGLIASVVITVWLPCELLSSYFDAFVFGPDDFRHSFQLTRFLDNFIGIIATAGVIFIAFATRSGQPATFGGGIGAGFAAWGRMWWTRFLSGLTILIGLLLLVIPGVYVATRLSFVESIVVAEHISGTDAMRRSFDITKGRFWQAFWLAIVVGLLVIGPVAVVILPTMFVPGLDYWLIDAAAQLACDVICAFGTVAFLCGYEAFSEATGEA